MQELSAAWRKMSQQEKDRYRQAAAKESAARGRSKTAGKTASVGKSTGGARQRSASSAGRQRRPTQVSFRYVYTLCVCMFVCKYVSLILGNFCDDRLQIFRVSQGRSRDCLRRKIFPGSRVRNQKHGIFRIPRHPLGRRGCHLASTSTWRLCCVVEESMSQFGLAQNGGNKMKLLDSSLGRVPVVCCFLPPSVKTP